ncbi:AAA family ATPase [Sulfurovum sp. XGS-02]|uniref:AAA family ATPase n=1 Tax=Sulfurovum sp. XGS-02 TaxID=2925411 RepID=UPI00206949A4|nr:AAA family ATPase [Sulfurovum sp. XGS-02]UPT76687.1 AAA family ATPase [Sulfurovum sp. XGS-02]
MTVKIVNNDVESSEGRAAIFLKSLFERSWKDSANETTKILLFPSVTCFGQGTRDIDLILLIISPKPVKVSTLNDTVTDKIYIRSLCCVIEIKDHDSRFVSFTGNTVHVYYKNGKKGNATKQNESQKYALKNYIEAENFKAPFINNLIWLTNIERNDIPRNKNNILPSNFNLNIFLNKIIDNNAHGQTIKKFEEKYYLDAIPPTKLNETNALEVLFAKRIIPTTLDRKKIEAITEKKLSQEEIKTAENGEIVVYQGNGGTGKTMYLLRLGVHYCSEGKRVLFLTYNTALAADIARLMVLSKIPDRIENAVHIQTVYSLIASLLKTLGVIPDKLPEDFLKKYDEYKHEALRYIKDGVVDQKDVDTIMNENSGEYDWDVILIDEAQDWPSNEFELLYYFYGSKLFFIADGTSQMIRTQIKSDWLLKHKSHDYILNKSLRLKVNLAQFCNQFASEIGLKRWSMEINNDLVGGQIIICTGTLENNLEHINQVLEDSIKSGNTYVDNLVCIPPSYAKGKAKQIIESLGIEVWDGTNEKVRRGYPTSNSMLRLIQYQSCRGLEGWSSINVGFDELYELKFNEYLNSNPVLTNFETIEDYAEKKAAQWLMIVLTRAVDTQFIHIRDTQSNLAVHLRNVAIKHKDFIYWIGE